MPKRAWVVQFRTHFGGHFGATSMLERVMSFRIAWVQNNRMRWRNDTIQVSNSRNRRSIEYGFVKYIIQQLVVV